jgi:hypothetical protein
MDKQDKGAAFERQLAEYFRINGYRADVNVVLEGKSGSRHEIDVLAEKSDGIVAFRVAVECKAWQDAIGKEVVSKLGLVLQDLGINKGIVVALNGWHQGAEAAARSFGIDLWGPDELTQKLGQVSLADLNLPSRRVTVEAVGAVKVPEGRLRTVLAGQSQGLLGLGAETVEWAQIVWVPFHLVKLSTSRPAAEWFRRTTMKVRADWHLYSAVNDRFWKSFAAEPPVEPVPAAARVPPRTTARQLSRRIADAARKWNEASTDRARERYATQLAELGIAPPASHVTVDSTRVVAHPFMVGLLTRRGRQRLVAVDASTGAVDAAIGEGLTQEAAFVTAAVAP